MVSFQLRELKRFEESQIGSFDVQIIYETKAIFFKNH